MGSTGNEINAVKITDNSFQEENRNIEEDKTESLIDEKMTKYHRYGEMDQREDYINDLYDLAVELKESLDGSEKKLDEFLDVLGNTPEDGDHPTLMNQNEDTVSTTTVVISLTHN